MAADTQHLLLIGNMKVKPSIQPRFWLKQHQQTTVKLHSTTGAPVRKRFSDFPPDDNQHLIFRA